MAVTPVASKYCCLTLQQMLDDIVGTENAPQGLVLETNGFMDAVTSGINTGSFQQVQTQSALGKALPGVGNRVVEIAYPVRQCDSVTAAVAGLCDTPATAGDDFLYDSVSVDSVQSTGFTLNREEFRQLCEEPNDRLQRILVAKFNDLKRVINNDLISKYIAGLGNYFSEIGDPLVPASGGTAKTLLPFNTAFQPNGMWMFPLTRDFRRNGWSGRPIIVSGTTVEQYVNPITQTTFQNNENGQIVNGVANYFSDYAVDTVFADALQHLISWVPGYIQMNEWYQYQENTIYEVIEDDYSQTKLTMDGFTVDFTMNFDKCTGTTAFTLSKYYDLFKIPDTALNPLCGQFSNGCLNWIIDCGDLDCNYSTL